MNKMNVERGWGGGGRGGERSHVGAFFVEVGLKHELKELKAFNGFSNGCMCVHICVAGVGGGGCVKKIYDVVLEFAQVMSSASFT